MVNVAANSKRERWKQGNMIISDSFFSNIILNERKGAK